MKRRSVYIVSFIFLIIFSFFLYKTFFKPKSELPNILFITVDALRADHMGVYNYKYDTSPNIDKFAEDSIVFNRAFCPIPKTSASFASMFTGLHPFVHGTRPNLSTLKLKYLTLAEALKSKGYYTFGMTSNGNLSSKFKFNQGFDRYEEVWNKFPKDKSSYFITDESIRFLKVKKQKPFFLWIHYIDTHTPYIPPKEYIEKREPGRKILEIKNSIILGTMTEKKNLRKNQNEGFFISLYDAEVKFVDNEIGKVLNQLEKSGLKSNTIVIISADHGEALGKYNYFFDHGLLAFNSSIRVPLIVSIPGMKSGRVNYNVSLMDIFPTILKKLNIKMPYKIQGHSLFSNNVERYLFIFGLRSMAVLFKDFHFVKVWSGIFEKLGIDKFHLFDLKNDINENNNIYNSNLKLSENFEKRYFRYYRKYKYLLSKKRGNVKKGLSEKDINNLKTLGYL